MKLKDKQVKTAKSIVEKLRGIRCQLGDDYVVLDKTAEDAAIKSVYAHLMAMIFDFELPNPGTTATRLFKTLCDYSQNSYEILRALKAARQVLIASDPNFDTYASLLQKLSSELDSRRLAVDIMSTLRPLLIDWLGKHSFSSYAQCLQFFTFAGHLNIPDCETYLKQGVTKMYEFELDLQGRTEMRYTTRESELFKEWFPRRNLDKLLRWYMPTHGTGATAELPRTSASLAAKYNQQENVVTTFDMWVSSKLDDYYNNAWRSPLDKKTNPRIYYGTLGELFPTGDSKSSVKNAKTLAPAVGTMVPKQWDKGRGISKEATHRAFQQAGCRKAIRGYLWDQSESRPEIAELLRHYTVKNDNLNRKLAQKGSLEGDYATIDLSSASDSITLKMVEQWFKETCLAELLLLTRSKQLQLVWPEIQDQEDGNKFMCYDPAKCESVEITCCKYAGMGNGTTFTVESLIFLAITWAAIESTGYDPSQLDWLIWGDDIIVPTECAEAVVKRLEVNGFTVNKDKSFVDRPNYLGWSDKYNREMWNCYRESCGGEYISGVDVTPIRVPRTFLGFDLFGAKNDPQSLASILDLYNEFDNHVYPTVRQLIKLELDQHFAKPSHTKDVKITEKASPFFEVIGPELLSKSKDIRNLRPIRIDSKYWYPISREFGTTDTMCILTHSRWQNQTIRINGHNYCVGGVLVAKYGKDTASGPVPSCVKLKYKEFCRGKTHSHSEKVHLFEKAVKKCSKFKGREGIYAYYESLHRLCRKTDERLRRIVGTDEQFLLKYDALRYWRYDDQEGSCGVRLSKPKDLAWEPRVRF